MRIYQVDHTRLDGDGSGGFSYFSNRRDAQREVTKVKATSECQINVLNIKPTKVGIIKALNIYAGHPDNG